MTFKEMEDLLKLINELEMTEFKMKDGEFELIVRTKEYGKNKKVITPAISAANVAAPTVSLPQTAPQMMNTQPAASSISDFDAANGGSQQAPEKEEKSYLEIKSPIVGTFYRSASPDKPPFVKVGDKVEEGSVVCIVEAMKLFNEIESEVSGTIVKVMVEDKQPVEYDTVLFLVEP